MRKLEFKLGKYTCWLILVLVLVCNTGDEVVKPEEQDKGKG